jgi:opacity protein-like surface antigen
MKISRFALALIFATWFSVTANLRAGENETPAADATPPSSATILDAPHLEFSAETAYLLSIAGNPNNYEIGSEFLTARLRWGVDSNDESFWRGYNQVYGLVVGEPIIRGPENHYFGISVGLRHVFVRPNSRLQFYTSAGVGLGWIDSTDEFRMGQGQDFTFNILSAGGMEYRMSDRFKLQLGILYQHLSNAGQTDPNPSLNLLGPQVGATFSF